MNPNPPITRALPALLAALLAGILAIFIGCAHVADVREVDPGFTAEALRTGGLANLGVVQVNEIPQIRPPLVEALERILAATRSDIPLVSAARAQARFDDSTSRLLLLGYQMHGAPEAVWLARAADSLHDAARYGVLARVESDVIRYSERSDLLRDSTHQSSTETMLVSGRDARVSVHVYELATRALVFSGTYRASAESAAVDSTPLQVYLDRMRAEAGLNVIPETPQGYPKPPPLARALENAFLEFARSLPGGPKPAKSPK